MHHMSMLTNKKHTAGKVAFWISIFRMMPLYLEFANIIGLALTELFQTVSSLLNGFVAICCHLFTVERVHTAHIFFVQCSSIMTAELFKFIWHTAIDVFIAGIVWQDRTSNAVSIEPVVFTNTMRCTIVVGAFAIGRKEMLREKRTQLFRQCRNDLIQYTQSTIFFVEPGFLFGKLLLPCGILMHKVVMFCA